MAGVAQKRHARRVAWLDRLIEAGAEPNDSRIALAVLFHCFKTDTCYPKVATLGLRAGLGETKTAEHLGRLIDSGALASTPRFKGKKRTSNDYAVVHDFDIESARKVFSEKRRRRWEGVTRVDPSSGQGEGVTRVGAGGSPVWTPGGHPCEGQGVTRVRTKQHPEQQEKQKTKQQEPPAAASSLESSDKARTAAATEAVPPEVASAHPELVPALAGLLEQREEGAARKSKPRPRLVPLARHIFDEDIRNDPAAWIAAQSAATPKVDLDAKDSTGWTGRDITGNCPKVPDHGRLIPRQNGTDGSWFGSCPERGCDATTSPRNEQAKAAATIAEQADRESAERAAAAATRRASEPTPVLEVVAPTPRHDVGHVAPVAPPARPAANPEAIKLRQEAGRVIATDPALAKALTQEAARLESPAADAASTPPRRGYSYPTGSVA